MCQQHIDRHCPAEVMCLRSIRGKQAIKVLLRFTQQLKPKCRSKLSGPLECLYKDRDTQQHTCFNIPALHRHGHVLQARKRSASNCEGTIQIVDGGERGVDSRLPLHLPSPHPVVYYHVYASKRDWDADSRWQKWTKLKRERDRERRGPKMALNV